MKPFPGAGRSQGLLDCGLDTAGWRLQFGQHRRRRRAHPAALVVQKGLELRTGTLRGLRIRPVAVNPAQGQLGGLADGAFFIGQGQHERFDSHRGADRAQGLGHRLSHVAIGVREQRQQGLGQGWIADAAQELHGSEAHFKAAVAQQAQEVGCERGVSTPGEHFGSGQLHSPVRVVE